MANKLIEMSSRLYNTPHLIDQQSFKWVESVIAAQANPEAKVADKSVDKKDKQRELQYNEESKVGVLSVHGPLTYVEYEAMCGEANASYQGISAEFDALAKAGAKTIVMDVDGPGGEAYGMMETGRELRKKADAAGINLIAYVDGLAASATYGLTAAAHEIIVNPEAEVGSIGVVVKLRNVNGAMKEMGIKDTYVYAGKSKIPYDADGEFTEEFVADVTEKVNAIYERFTSYVAEMQGISVEAVKQTEAKVFMAEQAVSLGLAHKIMTRESFFEYLADTVATGDKMLGRNILGFKKENVNMNELEKLQAEMSAMTLKTADLETALATATSTIEAKTAEAIAMAAALAAATEKLEAYAAAEKAELEAAETARIEARKAALVDAVGEVEASALYASLETLPDATFDLVVGKMKAASVTLETNPMFTEQGHGGGTEGASVDTSHLQALINKNYGPKA